MHRQGNVKDVFFCLFFGLYCNSPFCFRASDSYCLWLLDILRTPALNLCRVIVPLSLFSFLFFKEIILSLLYQPGVGTTALLVTTLV